jgi:hypothetical protein
LLHEGKWWVALDDEDDLARGVVKLQSPQGEQPPREVSIANIQRPNMGQLWEYYHRRTLPARDWERGLTPDPTRPLDPSGSTNNWKWLEQLKGQAPKPPALPTFERTPEGMQGVIEGTPTPELRLGQQESTVFKDKPRIEREAQLARAQETLPTAPTPPIAPQAEPRHLQREAVQEWLTDQLGSRDALAFAGAKGLAQVPPSVRKKLMDLGINPEDAWDVTRAEVPRASALERLVDLSQQRKALPPAAPPELPPATGPQRAIEQVQLRQTGQSVNYIQGLRDAAEAQGFKIGGFYIPGKSEIVHEVPGPEGTSAVVAKIGNGYSVTVRDNDSGMYVGQSTIYPTLEQAKAKAQEIRGPAAPPELPPAVAQPAVPPAVQRLRDLVDAIGTRRTKTPTNARAEATKLRQHLEQQGFSEGQINDTLNWTDKPALPTTPANPPKERVANPRAFKGKQNWGESGTPNLADPEDVYSMVQRWGRIKPGEFLRGEVQALPAWAKSRTGTSIEGIAQGLLDEFPHLGGGDIKQVTEMILDTLTNYRTLKEQKALKLRDERLQAGQPPPPKSAEDQQLDDALRFFDKMRDEKGQIRLDVFERRWQNLQRMFPEQTQALRYAMWGAARLAHPSEQEARP